MDKNVPIKLIIPNPSKSKANIKDLVFAILSRDFPLSLNKIFHQLKKQYNTSVTYQGVRKAIDSLLQEQILIKKNKQYLLNKDWILHVKNFISKLEMNYFSHKEKNIEVVTSSKEYKEYRFFSLYELDFFWSDLILDCIEKTKEENKKIIVAKVGYLWWMLLNLGNETKLNKEIMKRGFTFFLSSWKGKPLNKQALEINRKIGIKVNILNDNLLDYVDLNVVGNYVIEVRYSKRIIKKMESFYEEFEKIEKMDSFQLSNICHEKTEVTLKIFKNEVIARSLSRTLFPDYPL